jgi:hypothetical protein
MEHRLKKGNKIMTEDDSQANSVETQDLSDEELEDVSGGDNVHYLPGKKLVEKNDNQHAFKH